MGRWRKGEGLDLVISGKVVVDSAKQDSVRCKQVSKGTQPENTG